MTQQIDVQFLTDLQISLKAVGLFYEDVSGTWNAATQQGYLQYHKVVLRRDSVAHLEQPRYVRDIDPELLAFMYPQNSGKESEPEKPQVENVEPNVETAEPVEDLNEPVPEHKTSNSEVDDVSEQGQELEKNDVTTEVEDTQGKKEELDE